MKGRRGFCFLLALVLLLTVSPLLTVPARADGIDINEQNFPDPNFRHWISNACDNNHDDYLSASETGLSYMDVSGLQIQSLEGIQFFSSLQRLNCSENELTELVLGVNPLLTYLNCSNNKLRGLDLSGCRYLQKLYCANNQLTSLSMSCKLSLEYLDCSGNQFTELDVSGYSYLTELHAGGNQKLWMLICEECGLTALDVGGCKELKYLYCAANQLTALDLSQVTALVLLNCTGNRLTALDLSKNTALAELHCGENEFTGLNLNGVSSLEFLNMDKSQSLKWFTCAGCSLYDLCIENCPVLESLDCHNNALLDLHVNGCTALTTLNCSDNQLMMLNVSYCPNLTRLYCQNNQLEDMWVRKNGSLQKLSCYNNHFSFLDICACPYLKQAFSGSRTESVGINGPYYSYVGTDCRLEVDTSVIVQDELEPVIITVSASETNCHTGDIVEWYAYAGGGTNPLQYCFNVYRDGTIVRKGSYLEGAKHCSYTPMEPGTYTVKVFVKDAEGKSVSKMSGAVTVTIPISVASVKADMTAAGIGETITWTAAAAGGSGPLQYAFYIYKDGTIVKKIAYGASPTCSYMPAEAGTYQVKAYVKDSVGTTATKTGGTVTVSENIPVITSVTVNKASANTGDTVTWTASATGGAGALQYAFYIYRDGTIVKKIGYSASRTCSYTLAEAGTYQVKAYVKDSAGTAATKTGGTVTAAANGPVITALKVSKTAANTGETVTWTASATGGTGTLQYAFYIYRDGTIVKKIGYSASRTCSYTPTEAGSYRVKVFVKDGNGTAVTKTGGAVTVTQGTLTVTAVTPNRTSAVIGQSVTWTAKATGGTGTVKYAFNVYRNGTIVRKGSYSTAKTCTYTPTEAGSYTVKVTVKDGAGATAEKKSAITLVSVG